MTKGERLVPLQLDDVTHSYRRGVQRRPVLAGVDLQVAAGEVVGIAGPSGTGKSTLLAIAAGLLRPTSGQVRYSGRAAWSGRRAAYPRRGYVGMVFQDPVSSLDPRWTVHRCVAEPLRAGDDRRSGPAITELVIDALHRVGLAAVRPQARPDELSVGQLQRVVLARALLARPAVLLADEPTSALDVTSAAGVLHLLRRFADDGAALVVVSHDLAVLGALCDRRLHLDGGVLAEPAAR